MSNWQEKWDKIEGEIVTFEVGEKVWFNKSTPGIIREVREDIEVGSVYKYEVQLPHVTLGCSYHQLSKVTEEDL